MKRILAVLALAGVFMAARAQEQSAQMVQFLKEFPQRAGFNSHSYEFVDVVDTPAPKGYHPFYISHYGRHGSRSEWGGDHTYKVVRDILQEAKDNGIGLTSAGDSLLREAGLVYAGYNGMDGRLTLRGVREHEQLANRMYHRFPEVFKNGSEKIRAVSSTVPRCIVSMNGFTAQLRALQPSLELDLDTGEKFFAYIAQGENGTIRERTEKVLEARYAQPLVDSTTVFNNLFRDPEAGKKLVAEKLHSAEVFQLLIYYVAKAAEAYDINENIFRYLPFDAVYRFHEQQFLSAYLNQCNSQLNGDLRLSLEKPLVDTLVVQADRVVSGRSDRAADLTFGHDWPFLGLCSYLGLEGVGDRLSADEAAATWMASWNCPFAANLQMVFYRSHKESAPVLVKFLVNERETAIPVLTAVEGPYYNWEDVKAFLSTRVPHTQIVAHRGYWQGNQENSIESLKKAQEFGCWGSEFDLHLSSDDVVLVNHDGVVKGVNIQNNPSEKVKGQVPTLDEYLKQGAKNKDCVLVLELKPHKKQEREFILIDKCLEALKARKLLDPKRVAFISFSYPICKELAKRCPGFTVQYLEGDKSPAQVYADGINGIDYHYSCFKKHPEWVKEAHDLGMSVNVWTVNNEKDIKQMINLGVDQITTNEPALTREILFGRK
ncbi:MAG: hypothetical protein J6X99_06805 [Bacteroidales bacterium]|nr:hypothetical protein [Bacteroidales bacterium]